MPSDRLEGVALVTGGGRGIGASIARELADAGMRVAVTGRTAASGRSGRGRDRRARPRRRREPTATTSSAGSSAPKRSSGRSTCSARTRASSSQDGATWEIPVDAWWHVFEVNVLGVHLSCRAVIPGMLERGRGRIVITGSGAAYLPGSQHTAYPASKAAVCRYGETLANELAAAHPGVLLQPGARADRHDRAVRGRRALDSARARAAARSCSRIRPCRRASRSLPACGARRHRGSHQARRRGRRERPQRDTAAPLT